MSIRCTFVLATALAAGTASASVITSFNQVVLGNLQTGQDTEGRLFVGGNLTGAAAQVGTQLLPRGNYAGVDVLSVGGFTSVNNLQVEAGNFRRSGARIGGLNLNSGGLEIVDGAVAASVASVAADLFGVSSAFGGLAADSSVQAPSGQPGPMRFIATPGSDGVAVFSISASALTSSLVQQYELVTGGASSIVINVSGSFAAFNGGNFVGNWQNANVRATTIWNFTQATSIVVNRNFNGAILAPSAQLTNSTAIDGSVFVGSMVQNGEVHLPGYSGFIPAPGAGVLGALGGVMIGSRRRR
ncbi:MAG: collagen-binding domain-containing protein [Phycisphaerales bacterium]